MAIEKNEFYKVYEETQHGCDRSCTKCLMNTYSERQGKWVCLHIMMTELEKWQQTRHQKFHTYLKEYQG